MTSGVNRVKTSWRLFGVLLGLAAAHGLAEPYIAVRTGYKCSVCHLNQTCGGKRSEFGVVYTQTHLNMNLGGRKAFFNSRLNRSLSMGTNFRVEDLRRLEHKSSDTAVAEGSRQTVVPEANLYLQADLITDRLTFYLDQRFEPSTSNREIFGLYRFANPIYLKAGKMLLPYGLRIIDDEAFIRKNTNYNYNVSGLGVEAGWEPGAFSAVLNLTGTRLSSIAYAAWRRVRAGASYGLSLEDSKEFLYGVFGGVNFGIFTLLGEIDVIKTARKESRATLFEINTILMRGLNAKLTHEFLHPDAGINFNRNGRDRLTAGLEAFPLRFFQLSAFYRINRWVPENLEANQDEVLLRSQFFF